jgi:hypothetical protein
MKPKYYAFVLNWGLFDFRLRGLEQRHRLGREQGVAGLGQCSDWFSDRSRHRLDSSRLVAKVSCANFSYLP